MGNKKFVLKGREIFARSGLPNTHQLSLQARISAQTAYKYVDKPEDIQAVDCSILASILLDGVGLSVEEVLNMRVGDLFELK